MKRERDRRIRNDCIKQMFPCFVLHFFREMLSLTLPVLSAWMVGGMADALLLLDMERIRARFALFAAAFLLDAFALPAVSLWENLLLTRRGFGYGNMLFGRYLRLPVKTAMTIDTATLVRRVDSDSTDYYFLLMEKWTRPLTIAVTLAAMAALFVRESFSPLYALVIAALAALPPLRAGWIGGRRARLKKERLTYEDARQDLEYALFSARDFLRGFGLSGRSLDRLHGLWADYAGRTGAAQDRMDAAGTAFGFLCSYGVPLLATAAGALLTAAGRMALGALIAGLLVIPTVSEFYELLASLLLLLKEEAVTRDRLAIFYAGQEAEGESLRLTELRLRDLRFSYPGGGKAVFEGLSLRLPLAGITRLTGPNGAGKSTLISLLSGVFAPDGGEIADEQGRPLSPGALRASVSLLEQDGRLFSGTAAENLFIPGERLPEAEALLRELGFEKPLDTELTESGANLSPGERKKLTLARALLDPAPVLALDEPLNHLDAQGAEALLRRLARETRPVLLVSHADPGPLSCRELPLPREER